MHERTINQLKIPTVGYVCGDECAIQIKNCFEFHYSREAEYFLIFIPRIT